MIVKNRRGGALLLAWTLALLSCDSSTDASGNLEPITTNFNVNLSNLIGSAGGRPDSIVARIAKEDGGEVVIVLDSGRISPSGLIQFPVEAVEGSKVEVSYQVWRNDAVVGAGNVKWISGEPLTVPRPDLKPNLSFHGPGSGSPVVRRNEVAWFQFRSIDPENALTVLSVDWNGDGRDDDSLTPLTGIDSIPALWNASGSYRVLATVRDRFGLVARDSLRVLVVGGVRLFLSPDTLVSIGDSVDLHVGLDLDSSSQHQGIRLAWSGLGSGADTTGVVAFRRVAWNREGVFRPRVTALDVHGKAATDSVVLEVIADPPQPDLSRLPSQVDAGTVSLLPVSAVQRFGRIEGWAMDFDGDTASGWDTVLTGPPTALSHLFPAPGVFRVLVKAVDDDGNRGVGGREIVVASNSAPVLDLESRSDTTVSIGDSAEIRFARQFADGDEAGARLEWRIDGGAILSEPVVLRRKFSWSGPGEHEVAWRVVMPSGRTVWDTVRIEVVRGVPVVLEVDVLGSSVARPFHFSARVDPVFGSIVRSRWDFGNDGTWDDSAANPVTQISRTFATSDSVSVRFQALDDDGNTVDTVFSVMPTNVAPSFGVVDFAASRVGVRIPAALRATFTDPDGASDLSTLSLDWDGDGIWDTVRTVTGLGLDEIRHAWSAPGLRNVRARIADRSGRFAIDSVRIDVRADAPRILSLRESNGRTTGRPGDTLWFIASIADSSLPVDLDSIRWSRDGLPDRVVSLRNATSLEARIPVATRETGSHSITAIVSDQVGNSDSASATWTVETAPPLVVARLRDSVIVARDTATLVLDSLRPGRLGGGIVKVEWSFGNSGTWSPVSSPAPGKATVLRLPSSGDSAWYVVVRATQDNGESFLDTVRAELLPSFVDKRDGTVYPYVRVGTTTWMARNLSWKPSLDDSVQSTCAGDNQCSPLGRLYSVPVPLRDEPSSSGAPHSVSVCPEGWRLPTDLEFNELIETGRTRRPDLSYGQILRARTGWTSPLPSQPDPLRFSALPTLAFAAEQFTAWWTFSPQPYPDPRSEVQPYPNQMNQSLRILDNDGLPHQTKYWSTQGASVRCVRLKEIVIDTSWKPAAENFDSAWMPVLQLRGLAPEASVPVTIRATIDGRSVETTMVPTGHVIPWTSLPQLPYTGIGTFEVRLEARQGNVTFTDTLQLVVTAPE